MFESFKQEELEELYSILDQRKNRIVIERIIALNNKVLPLEVLAANVDIVRSEADRILAVRSEIIKSIDLVNNSNTQLQKKCKLCETLMKANNILRQVVSEIEEDCKCYCCDEESNDNVENNNVANELLQHFANQFDIQM